MSIIGDLVEARKRLGISQSEVARRMGVAQPTVSGFESSSDTHLSTLNRYAIAIGVELELEVIDLTTGDAGEPPEWGDQIRVALDHLPAELRRLEALDGE